MYLPFAWLTPSILPPVKPVLVSENIEIMSFCSVTPSQALSFCLSSSLELLSTIIIS